ncbi:hypothetical protein BST81_11585 [Leptolyngbya sp. 'hensonii']|uniref:peptidoglycan-binding domain-containing protein n=1 Tax=Leptolyngbya sp. 'hensonii' TaxID=1922337 RepID=UPI00094FD0BC|nr:peptidoglycan-binding protein [Leptolyngbya sp. 'hensonii']OLP18249.1 hypothetical protein BST81_11585 [Leptolyngbya sp. 'hensonii']
MELLAYQHAALLYEAYVSELHRRSSNGKKPVSKKRRGKPRSQSLSRSTASKTLHSLLLSLALMVGFSQNTLAALSRGSRGPAVTALQLNLKNAGYDPGRIDGVFGSGTERAVRRFQRDRGLPSDGIVGRQTEAVLTGGSSSSGGTSGSSRPPSGISSSRTRELQRLLANQRCYSGPIDGIYGPQTNAAVIRAQRAYGLVEDGVPGPATLAALRGSRCRCL